MWDDSIASLSRKLQGAFVNVWLRVLTWILDPFLQRLLQPPDVQGLRRHPDEGHDLEELLLPGLAQLVDVVAALGDEGVVVREEVGTLQYAVQLKLRLVARLTGHGNCGIKQTGVR